MAVHAFYDTSFKEWKIYGDDAEDTLRHRDTVLRPMRSKHGRHKFDWSKIYYAWTWTAADEPLPDELAAIIEVWDSPQPKPEEPSDCVDLRVTNLETQKKIGAIQVIRLMTDMGLKDAKKLVEDAQEGKARTVLSRISRTTAGAFAVELVDAGFTVQIVAALSAPEQTATVISDEKTSAKKRPPKRIHAPRKPLKRTKTVVRYIDYLKPKIVENGKGFVRPSYWDDLMLYLAPGMAEPVIALVGPTGNGKTTTAEEALKALGYETVVIDMDEFMEPADLVGDYTYKPDVGEVWVDGKVTKAFREGKALLINEFDAANPRAAMCLQSAFQNGPRESRKRYITLKTKRDEDRVYPVGDCPIILTMNTYGTGATREFVGRNRLDAAQLDRIEIIDTDYENEVEILIAAGYDKAIAKQVVDWALPVREKIAQAGLSAFLSPRTLQRMAKAMQYYGWSLEVAAEKRFLRRFPLEDRALLTTHQKAMWK